MSHLENKIESLTRKWWVLHKQQRAGFDEECEELEGEKDRVVELLAELKLDVPPFPLGSQE